MPTYTQVAGSEVAVFNANDTSANPQPVAVGDLVVVAARAAQLAPNISVTDTAGNTYRRITKGPGSNNLTILYSIATAAHANNVYTLSADLGGISFQGLAVSCFTNSDGWTDFDIVRTVVATWRSDANPNILNVFTYQDELLLVMCCNADAVGNAYSAGTGFTEVVEDASNILQMQFKTEATAVSNQSYGVTQAGVGRSMILVAFGNPAGGGGENNYGAPQ